jgi:phospholipid transport system substrate-binding protein
MALAMRYRSVLAFVSILLISFACPRLAGAAMDIGQAQQFVLEGVERTSRILQAHADSRAAIAEKLRAEFRNGFDIATIANFALGTARAQMSEDQRTAYVREFEELIVQTYTSRVIHYGPRVTGNISDIIRFTGHTPITDDQVMLHSRVNRKAADWVGIDWRVRRKQGRFLIIDIVILGISQATLYKSEIGAVVQQNGRGVDGLVDALRKKSAAIRSGG